MSRLALQALTSVTSIGNGAGVDVSAVKGPDNVKAIATLVVHVESFGIGETARLEVVDTVDNFSSDKVPVYVTHIQGGLDKTSDRVDRIPWYDIPDARFGVTSSKMRVDVTSISGGTLVYESWVEY